MGYCKPGKFGGIGTKTPFLSSHAPDRHRHQESQTRHPSGRTERWQGHVPAGDGKGHVPGGSYPDVTLAQARDAMGAARKLLVAGSDTMVQRKADKLSRQSAAENSFQTVALLWRAQWMGAKSPRHADDVHKRLKVDVFAIQLGHCCLYVAFSNSKAP